MSFEVEDVFGTDGTDANEQRPAWQKKKHNLAEKSADVIAQWGARCFDSPIPQKMHCKQTTSLPPFEQSCSPLHNLQMNAIWLSELRLWSVNTCFDGQRALTFPFQQQPLCRWIIFFSSFTGAYCTHTANLGHHCSMWQLIDLSTVWETLIRDIVGKWALVLFVFESRSWPHIAKRYLLRVTLSGLEHPSYIYTASWICASVWLQCGIYDVGSALTCSLMA